MLTIGEAFHRLRTGLSALYDAGEAASIADLLLEHLTVLRGTRRLIAKSTLLSTEQWEQFNQLESRLLRGAPVQYVTGHAYFLGRLFEVSPAVLIPRPETEELVQWILSDGAPGSMLDIGTGSGCIAISLQLGAQEATVAAIDLSEEALVVARKNAESLAAEVAFFGVDFLDASQWEGLGSYDVIVSNPPYIPLNERTTLHRNVRDWEPEGALFVPEDDALLFYRAIAEFGLRHLLPGGRIYCELHRDYAEATRALFKEAGYGKVELREDLFENPRMIRAML